MRPLQTVGITSLYYKIESEERVSGLERDGFKMHILTRSRDNEVLNPKAGYHHTIHRKWKYEAEVAIWGPDGLAIATPVVYSYEAITSGVRTCGTCGAKDVETQRVGFANRCCTKCAPEQKRIIERPGWCD